MLWEWFRFKHAQKRTLWSLILRIRWLCTTNAGEVVENFNTQICYNYFLWHKMGWECPCCNQESQWDCKVMAIVYMLHRTTTSCCRYRATRATTSRFQLLLPSCNTSFSKWELVQWPACSDCLTYFQCLPMHSWNPCWKRLYDSMCIHDRYKCVG